MKLLLGPHRCRKKHILAASEMLRTSRTAADHSCRYHHRLLRQQGSTKCPTEMRQSDADGN